jgi:hypothetical protein
MTKCGGAGTSAFICKMAYNLREMLSFINVLSLAGVTPEKGREMSRGTA